MNRALLALLCTASLVVVAQDSKAKPAPAPAAKAAPAAAILGNRESKTFHKADCSTAAKMKEANKTAFATAAEATKAGYKACKVCKP